MLFQADLAEMFPFGSYKYFLCVIDVFSLHLYVRPLENKTANAVKEAFKEIFEEIGTQIQKLETDQGKEFIALKSFFKESKIYFHVKTGTHKAGYSEQAIGKFRNVLLLL